MPTSERRQPCSVRLRHFHEKAVKLFLKFISHSSRGGGLLTGYPKLFTVKRNAAVIEAGTHSPWVSRFLQEFARREDHVEAGSQKADVRIVIGHDDHGTAVRARQVFNRELHVGRRRVFVDRYELSPIAGNNITRTDVDRRVSAQAEKYRKQSQ
jgi:hypothetical protein